MARVVHMTSVHPADDIRIVYKECRALAEHGHQVILIASRGELPRVPGVELVRVPTPRNRLERLIRTVPAVLREAWRADADIYHFHDPELLPVGLILKARGKRVVYDAHEDVPKQIRAKPYLAAPVRCVLPRMVEVVERGIARRLDGVITATERVADRLGRPRSQAIHNYPTLAEFPPEPPPWAAREPVLAYVGALDETRGLAEMLEVGRRISTEHPGSRLVLAGRASAETRMRFCELADPAVVEWRGFQTRDQIVDLLQEAQIGLCVLHPTPAYIEAIPTKVFEYMAAGTVSVCSDFAYWRELFGDGAVYVDPQDPRAIAEVVLGILRDPVRAAAIAARGHAMTLRRHNWDAEARKLVSFYEQRLAA